MNIPVVAIVGSFDTKGAELQCLADAATRGGCSVMRIDCGVLGEAAVPVDVSATELAERAGTTLKALRAGRNRGDAIGSLGRAAGTLLGQLWHSGEIHGLISAGGSNNATLFALASRELPFGVPKVLVSTVAAGDTRPYVHGADVMMMYPVVDVEGLNSLSVSVLERAGAAVAAMSAQALEAGVAQSTAPIAATMFGVTTPCVSAARRLLEGTGDEVIVFHATGVGGQSFEQLISDGAIRAALDLTTTELADELAGGVLSAGPGRLTAAAAAGIPQAVSLGALDMVNFGPRDTVPPQFADRHLYAHNENVTLMRTSAEENASLGAEVAGKLSRAKGPASVLIPLRGVSALDIDGGPFEDKAADAALFRSLRSALDPCITLLELDLHINDPEFARCAVEELRRNTGKAAKAAT